SEDTSINTKETLRELAIKESVKDAVKKAVLISETANVELSNIYKIIYGNSWDFPMAPMSDELACEQIVEFDSMSESSFSFQGIDFNPKEISIKKTITVVWKIKEK
ncbi:SIMPL domain-containing protein, partial [Bacteroidota bacterium]